ncbi:hypothetical protein AMQ84_15575 [Paenibacillus riograndensis]|uniref:Uncharacterized protein n=1 Tax=Paenibacillus riograndensis TaxID=483937 RepID=A0A132TYJ7_9BACL|nr:hypothetical protein AMQ84_15575 [Paenibacillus riograndensis]KWX88404.1 hypothetical protein AMQ83_06970 [Paenibacillus riograndensis]
MRETGCKGGLTTAASRDMQLLSDNSSFAGYSAYSRQHLLCREIQRIADNSSFAGRSAYSRQHLLCREISV